MHVPLSEVGMRHNGLLATALAVTDDCLSVTRPLPIIPITVIVPTLNESARIRDAIEALSWADEVIVADGGSRDRTRELAGETGAKVIEVLGGTIASQRNAGIAVARNRWILALDADEHVPDQLRDEIAAIVKVPQREAYRIRFRNFYLGREIHHGSWGNEYHVRLFRSDRRFHERRVHETLEAVDNLGLLCTALEHTPYRDMGHHIEKMARYGRWGAEDLAFCGHRSSSGKLVFRPVWRFVREYFVYGGWRDGRAGLVLALLSASSVLLKYAHLQALEWQAETQSAPTHPIPLPNLVANTPQRAGPVSSDS
jgi:glycosyltransferase involved in cell wall biosynthesis